MLEDAVSKVYITREGDFTRADIFSVDEVEIFKGRENRITMVQTYSKKFHCTYLLHNFPFDTQVRFIQVRLKNPYLLFNVDLLDPHDIGGVRPKSGRTKPR